MDQDGNLCPNANHLVQFEVSGAGTYRASGNGAPRDLMAFHESQWHAFYGKCMAILQAGEQAGEMILKASAEGLEGAEVRVILD